ncbi:MAG: cytidine deaminase [Bacteroidota bacterium]
MPEQKFEFSYDVYNSIDELNSEDAWLLNEAKEVTQDAYAPYSNFRVGAVAKLSNGEIVAGTNQENASFPAGLCAERVLLASVSSIYPNTAIESIAISYQGNTGSSNHPISPCGVCRQTLQEFEQRTNQPIRLILGGMEGKIFIINKSSFLLPLAFTSEELK